MAFNDYVAELIGATPRLSAPLAIKLINRAWAEIRDIRLWSFLVGYGDLYAPALITAGTVSVTAFSASITFDAAARTALNASQSLPPIASTSIGVGRQFRVGSTSNAGAIYSLLTYDGTTGIATLDRPYNSTTNTQAVFMVYRAYYQPPSTDFVAYRSIINQPSGYGIIRDALNVPQQSLAVFDPQRSSTGDAYYISPFVTNTVQGTSYGEVAHEFYPHPTNQSVYSALYVKRGQDLSATVDLPSTFPSYTMMQRAYMHACDWALKNVPMMPELQQTNWVIAKQSHEKMWRENIIQAIKQDDQFYPAMPMRVGRYYSQFPLGGNWLQSHALPPGYMSP